MVAMLLNFQSSDPKGGALVVTLFAIMEADRM